MILPVLGLVCIGFTGLLSASLHREFLQSAFFRQSIWLVIALGAVFVVSKISPKIFYEYSYYFYIILLVVIVLTFFMPTIMGSRRWIALGTLRLQPSEFGKILVVFAVAKYLSDYQEKLKRFVFALPPLLIVVIPAVLVFSQPDLGTSLIYLGMVFPMMYWGGIRPFHLFMVLAPIISIITGFNFYSFSLWMLLLILVLYFSRPTLILGIVLFVGNALFGTLAPSIWESLHPYQQNRIVTLLDTAADPHGSGYQVLQSRTAIGSGGLFGKGLGEGTQTHLRFLPVSDTDFVIAVIGEELGFMVILVVLALFAGLLLRMINRAASTYNRFTSLVIMGFVSVFMVHIFVNMGMVTGLLPVTGLPLPFMSYGGSFLITSMLMIGITNQLIYGEV